MQLSLPFISKPGSSQRREAMLCGPKILDVQLVRSRRARRYVLRIEDERTIRVAVPRGGSFREARAFARKQHDWILRQLRRLRSEPKMPRVWRSGTEILFRGAPVALTAELNGSATKVRFGDQSVVLREARGDLRGGVEAHLRRLAERELPGRTKHLANTHGVEPKRISVRNQSTRWGSCSAKGTVSLNWRLIQVPPFVRDYIILHELMHLHELNHSPRFWRRVEKVCPDYREAEHWLKHHWPRPA